jgi:hypothetical protein
MTTDHKIAYSLGALFVVLCAVQLPPAAALQLSALGLAAMAAAGFVAGVLGDRATPAFSILVVSLAAFALLVMPEFPAMGGTHRAAVPLGFLGTVATTLIWVTHRWPALHRDRGRTGSFGSALWIALAFAVILSLIASVPLAIIWLGGEGRPEHALIYAAYFVGALAAAVLYRLVRRLQYLASGRYLIGGLCGFCLYAAVAPVVAILDNEPLVWTQIVTVGIVAGVFVGPPVAFGLLDAD